MITDKEILKEGVNTEIDLLKNKVNNLENQLASIRKNFPGDSEKIKKVEPVPRNKTSFLRILPTAAIAAFASFLLFILLEFVITDLILMRSYNAPVSLIVTYSIICGGIAYYFKLKNEKFQKLLNKESTKNEKLELIIETDRKGYFKTEKQSTSPIWEIGKSLKKKIFSRNKTNPNVTLFNNPFSNSKILEEKNYELKKLNEELKQSELNLRELNNSKDKFFSILAHDLKNPFASIIGLAEFLNEEITNLNQEEAKKLARSISNSAKRVHRLLENLLKWSLVQTGRIQFHPAEFNLKNLIDETTELFVQNAEYKNIELKIEYGHTSLVFADFNMIETAIRNLISNALKFTKSGGHVLVKTIQQKQFVRVDIIDNGIGIKESDQNKIFCIEEHTNIAGTGNEKGTGIGLVLSKEFVEKNGGKIWFKSELGKGSEFNLTIPAAGENEKVLFDVGEIV